MSVKGGIILLILFILSSCAFLGRRIVSIEDMMGDNVKRENIPESIEAKRVENHTVKKGETLYRISRNYGVPIEVIARYNEIEDATVIYAGQTVKIPFNWKKEKDGKGEKKRKFTGSINDSSSFLTIWPLKGVNRDDVEVKFGRVFRDDLGIFTNNNGINIKVNGEPTIYSVRPGKVKYLSFIKGIGQVVGLNVGKGYYIFYYPCEDVSVKKSTTVKKGQPLARVSGEELHFEVRKGKTPVNPLLFLP